ncbi:hypothetical protein JOB18_011907, partial [Solea senegalensis]
MSACLLSQKSLVPGWVPVHAPLLLYQETRKEFCDTVTAVVSRSGQRAAMPIH